MSGFTTYDADAELTAWWEANAEDLIARQGEEAASHRCPSDMPPCPECQDREEREAERECDLP